MPSLVALARWEGLILIASIFGVILWKLLTGGLSLDQLLEGDIRDPSTTLGWSTYLSVGRVQSLMIALFVASCYLLQVLQHPNVLPSISKEIVEILAGSNALYLGGKAQALLLGRLRDLLI